MRLASLLLLLVPAAGCGGGGGSGGDPPPPPPPPYADLLSTGLAVAAAFPNAAVIGTRVLFAVSEIEMQADLNGDGDQLDSVLHELDVTTDATANLGRAIAGPILASDKDFAFLVSEAAQGGTDLNGDGDSGDTVWHVYRAGQAPGGGTLLNTMAAAPATTLPGAATRGGFVLPRSEVSQGADLNGDGDQTDIVPALFDGGPFAVSPIVPAAQAPATPLPARNGRVLMAVSEAAAGATDLNGDGDATDIVIHVVEFQPLGPVVFTRLGAPGGRAIANHPYGLTDNAAIYFIDEATDGPADLNIDGDTNDAIIAVFDIGGASGEATPTTPLLPTLAIAGGPAFGFGAGANRVLVGVSEAGNAGVDLNTDGDSNDTLAAWVDTTPGQQHALHVLLLPLASFPMQFSGTRGLFAVSELGIGFAGQDLNGDTDVSDPVLHFVETVGAGVVTNLGLAAGGVVVSGDDVLVGVSEAAQGGTNLNGDADAIDIVDSWFDFGALPPQELRLGIAPVSVTLFRLSPTEIRIAALMPEGHSAKYADMNGDGDEADNFVLLLKLDPSKSPAGPFAPTPFYAGIASLGGAPPLRAGIDVFLFPTSEVSLGMDLNADGDLFDTVLRYTRIRPPE